jgi:hypothetical protein
VGGTVGPRVSLPISFSLVDDLGISVTGKGAENLKPVDIALMAGRPDSEGKVKAEVVDGNLDMEGNSKVGFVSILVETIWFRFTVSQDAHVFAALVFTIIHVGHRHPSNGVTPPNDLTGSEIFASPVGPVYGRRGFRPPHPLHLTCSF